ncbi:hypothetical protein [Gluconobacter cerinus]|uniref:hypothetical protein n=1 Tax=Gluconobacter cerinus TaxID=38307 RepID=UPI0039E9C926
MEGRVWADLIRDCVDLWSRNDTLSTEQLDDDLAYFRARYFADGAFTYWFNHLRDRDHPDIIAVVIGGANDDPSDRMLALLIIIWLLRNNLFHGTKWAYQMLEQHDNFRHVSAVLMRLLENHFGGLT